MSNASQKLGILSSRFYLYISVSPAHSALIDVYNISKYGDTINDSRRTYEGETLQQAIDLAYSSEILKESSK